MLLPGDALYIISDCKRLRKNLESMPVIGRRARATNVSAYNLVSNG